MLYLYHLVIVGARSWLNKYCDCIFGCYVVSFLENLTPQTWSCGCKYLKIISNTLFAIRFTIREPGCKYLKIYPQPPPGGGATPLPAAPPSTPCYPSPPPSTSSHSDAPHHCRTITSPRSTTRRCPPHPPPSTPSSLLPAYSTPWTSLPPVRYKFSFFFHVIDVYYGWLSH